MADATARYILTADDRTKAAIACARAGRVANWQQAYVEAITRWSEKPFEYGTRDCCQFAADVVLAITGGDYRKRFPKYESREQAEAILSRHGGMLGLANSVLGDSVAPARARRGDVVAADLGVGMQLGICGWPQSEYLSGYFFVIGERGLTMGKMRQAQAAWSI